MKTVEHLQKKFSEKNREMRLEYKDSRIVYLDLNYWVEFLKLDAGKPVRPHLQEFAQLLTKLVEIKKIVIPISDIHLYEAFKKKAPERYNALIRKMGAFSKNVCFIPQAQRIENEALLALRVTFGIEYIEDLRLSLTAPFFALYILFMKNPNLSQEQHESFLDYSYNVTLERMYSNREFEVFEIDAFEKRITEILSTGKMENPVDSRTIAELFQKELYGGFSTYEKLIDSLLSQYFITYQRGENKLADRLLEIPENERPLRLMDLILTGMIESRDYSILPSLAISCGIHSVLRWNKELRYARTQAFDIMHAEVGIPMSDYFFGDKGLCALITNPQLNFAKAFPCKVLKSPEEGIRELSKL
jgi:hypothetical protein